MRELTQYAAQDSPHTATLTLPYWRRTKTRQRVRLDDGEEVALLLPRGGVLRDGDRLLANDGRVVLVRAAREQVSSVRASDPIALARAAYHLGNRHMPVQIGAGWLRYQHDHVLDEMVRGLGLEVSVGEEAFQPEGGAYGHGDGHGDGHEHEHGDGHGHEHEHGHEHGHGHGHGHGGER